MHTTSLLVLLTVAFSAALQLRASDPMLPVMATDLGVSLRDAFLLSSAFALPMGFMQLVLGPTADALGKVRVIRAAILTLAIGTVLSALADSYGQLLAARVLTGAAAGGIVPMTMALMADKVPPAGRQAAFGRVMSASTLGQVIGATMAGVLVGTVGWRATYYIMAAADLIGAFGALFLVERDVAQARPVSFSRAAGDYARILGSRGAKLIAVTSLLNGMLVMGLLPLLAPLHQQRGGDGPLLAGITIAGFALGGFVLGIAMRWLAGRVPIARLMQGGFALAGAMLLVIAQPLPWMLTVGLFVLVGFGFFTLQNSLLALVTDLVPEARGSAVSILIFCLFTGQMLGPIVWGLLAEQFGFAGCFAVAGILLLVYAAMLGLALRAAGLPRLAD